MRGVAKKRKLGEKTNFAGKKQAKILLQPPNLGSLGKIKAEKSQKLPRTVKKYEIRRALAAEKGIFCAES